MGGGSTGVLTVLQTQLETSQACWMVQLEYRHGYMPMGMELGQWS